MRAAFTDFSITPEPLSSLQLADLAVHADEEHRVMTKQRHEIDVPTAKLDHVLDDHVVAGIGDRRGTAVEPVEEARPDGPPRPLPGLCRPIYGWQNVRIDELIGRPIEERRAQGGLYGAPQGRLSGTARSIQEYDSRRFHVSSRSSRVTRRWSSSPQATRSASVSEDGPGDPASPYPRPAWGQSTPIRRQGSSRQLHPIWALWTRPSVSADPGHRPLA